MIDSWEDKVCIVTGANSGIGYETAKLLASKGAQVALVCRNRERGEIAKSKIIEATGNSKLSLFIADLSLMSQVKQFVKDFLQQYDQLHLLVNNAGAPSGAASYITEEGIESTFALNFFASVLLMESFADILRQSSPSAIVNVLSDSVGLSQKLGIDLLDLQKMMDSTMHRYAGSKAALDCVSKLLYQDYAPDEVFFQVIYPSFQRTSFAGNATPPAFRWLVNLVWGIVGVDPSITAKAIVLRAEGKPTNYGNLKYVPDFINDLKVQQAVYQQYLQRQAKLMK